MATNPKDQYLGNPNLKKGNTKSRFTKKQVEEVPEDTFVKDGIRFKEMDLVIKMTKNKALRPFFKG